MRVLTTSAEKAALKTALSQVLRELREKHPERPTQDQLAASVGLDRSYWGDLERGERSLTLFNLWRMAQALGVSPSRLVAAVDQNYRRMGGSASAAGPRLTPVQKAIQRLRAFMDQSPEMKWLADPRQKALYCNRPLRVYVGVVDQLGGLAWQELLHPDDLEKYLAHSRKMYAAREPYLSRYRMRGADGQFKSMVQHAVPQFTPKGVFLGFLGTLIQEPPENGS